MAIGSDAEIGVSFGRLSEYPTWDSVLEWHRQWREYVGGDLLGGYATLCYPPQSKE